MIVYLGRDNINQPKDAFYLIIQKRTEKKRRVCTCVSLLSAIFSFIMEEAQGLPVLQPLNTTQ